MSLFRSSACEFLCMIHLFNFSKHSVELTLSSLEYPCLSISFHVPGCLSYSPLQYQQFFYCCSVTQLGPIICDPMDCSTPGLPAITNSQSLLKLMSIESLMSSNHLILFHPLLLLPSITVFSSEFALRIRWPKYWSFCFNISPSNEYSGLVSFRINWFDFFAVQGTLKSLLQH